MFTCQRLHRRVPAESLAERHFSRRRLETPRRQSGPTGNLPPTCARKCRPSPDQSPQTDPTVWATLGQCWPKFDHSRQSLVDVVQVRGNCWQDLGGVGQHRATLANVLTTIGQHCSTWVVSPNTTATTRSRPSEHVQQLPNRCSLNMSNNCKTNAPAARGGRRAKMLEECSP